MIAPLDTIHSLWRAQSPIDGAIPSDGQNQIPLVLGATTASEAADPVYVASPDRMEIREWTATTPQRYAQAAIPVAALNGDFTLFMDLTPKTLQTTHQALWYIIDSPENDSNPGKRVFSYGNTSKKPQFRIFKTNGATVDLIGATSLNVNERVHLAFSYKSDTKTMKVYRNGLLDGTIAMGAADVRSTVTVPLLRLCSPIANPISSSAKTNFDFHAGGFDNRCWTDEEVFALESALPDYLANGSNPPPPPPPNGVNLYKLNGVDVQAMTIKRNGVDIAPPPTTPGDVLYEVDY